VFLRIDAPHKYNLGFSEARAHSDEILISSDFLNRGQEGSSRAGRRNHSPRQERRKADGALPKAGQGGSRRPGDEGRLRVRELGPGRGRVPEIDPYTSTLSDPTEDGYIRYTPLEGSYYRGYTWWGVQAGKDRGGYPSPSDHYYRGYVEWDISSIPDGAMIDRVKLKYHGEQHGIDCHVHAITYRPTTSSNKTLYYDVGDPLHHPTRLFTMMWGMERCMRTWQDFPWLGPSKR